MSKIDLSSFKGGEVTGTALLAAISDEMVARNNNPFIRVTFSDGNVTMTVCIFMSREDFRYEVGSVMNIHLRYQGSNIDLLEYSLADVQDPENYILTAEIAGETSFDQVMGTLYTMKKAKYPENPSDTIYDVAMQMLLKHKMQLVKYPASAKYHHTYEGGLMYYINMLVRDAFIMSKSHPHGDWEVIVSALAVCEIGKLMGLRYDGFSDIKTTFFAETRSEVEYAANEAEIIMGPMNIDPLRKENLLLCIRASRMKKEWGATVYPLTLESHYVATICMMEAKADVYIENEKHLAKGEGTKEPPREYRFVHNIYRLS